MDSLGLNDMVFSKNSDGNITAAGFNIDSHLMKQGESAAHVFPDNTKTGGGLAEIAKVSDMFKGLAVPAGLFYLQQNIDVKYPTKSDNETVEPSLFDRLSKFALETPDKEEKQSKRQSRKQSRKQPQKQSRKNTRKVKKNTSRTSKKNTRRNR